VHVSGGPGCAGSLSDVNLAGHAAVETIGYGSIVPGSKAECDGNVMTTSGNTAWIVFVQGIPSDVASFVGSFSPLR
jgi:hypothetical protein